MAQALFERHAPTDLRAESAGSDPARAVWPGVVEAMDEIGIDLRGRNPRRLSIEMQLPTKVEDWEIPDPADRPIEEVRSILSEYDEAPVRSFVMSLAHRRSRECLAAESCDALATA